VRRVATHEPRVMPVAAVSRAAYEDAGVATGEGPSGPVGASG